MILFFGCASQRYQYISANSPVNSAKTQSSPAKVQNSSTKTQSGSAKTQSSPAKVQNSSTKTQSGSAKNVSSSTDKSGNNGKHEMRGEASWYGPGFHGKATANGEKFNQNAMTAAHKTLGFDTKVKVTDLQTGKSVVVRINDRGPYAKGRIIDLSKGAAEKLGIKDKGHAKVKLEIVK